jgi:cysteine desulfurase/selenocysteine lyase
MEEYDKLLSDRTKIVTVNHISNALGTVESIRKSFQKHYGRRSCFNGAQAVPHLRPDVQALDCDFMYSLDIKYNLMELNFIMVKKIVE